MRRHERRVFGLGVKDELEETHMLDLDQDAVNRELERERAGKLSGPIAENILRDIGTVRAAKTG